MKTIGIVPCAGRAERLGGIPKYLLPLEGGSYLLAETCRKLHAAGAQDVYIGAGLHNQAVLDNYAPADCTVYRVNHSHSMSETVAAARPYIASDAVVLMTMPDTFFDDEYVLSAMLGDIQAGASVAVGVWVARSDQRSKLGMCDIGPDWRLLSVDDKPASTELRHAWGAIAWRAPFWDYIKAEMPNLSYSLDAAVRAGLDIRCSIAGGQYYDLGTFQELREFYAAGQEVI